MTPTSDEAFPIAWQDPGDPDVTWEWDDMHTPRALTPLGEDYVNCLGIGFVYRYERLGVPLEIPIRIWNGYAYFGFRVNAPEDERDAVMSRYTERRRDQVPSAAHWWRTEALPELKAMYREIDDVAVEDLPHDRLAEAWIRAWAHADRAWSIHFFVITGPYQVLDDLVDFYESVVEDGNAGDALGLVAGLVDELREVEEGLERLTAEAAAAPSVAGRLRAPAPVSIDELTGLDGAAAFVSELQAFLALHGHLGQVTEDLAGTSWSEDPAPLLADLGRRLDQGPPSSAERWAARRAAADATAGLVRDRLADQPEKLAIFETLLAGARDAGPLTEAHNYWIDRMCSDRLRRFALRVGRRLVRDGILDSATDIEFLTRAELPRVLTEGLDPRPLVTARRREHTRRQGLRPPAVVGKPKKVSTEIDRFEGGRFETTDEATIQGTGASAGLVRGPARLVLGPADFDRVAAGDIVVAAASNPGWVPLFAIAGGFVTDTGGVLSHAAVVAREFGLPAVVGTGDGTRRISDGQMIEIDGAAGVVRLM